MIVAAFWARAILAVSVAFVALLAVLARRVVLPLARQADAFAAAAGVPPVAAKPVSGGCSWWLEAAFKTHPSPVERARTTPA